MNDPPIDAVDVDDLDELAAVKLARSLIAGYQRLAKARRHRIELLTQARDELRLWLRQLHGIEPKNATVDGERLTGLIGELDTYLHELAQDTPKATETVLREAVEDLRAAGLGDIIEAERAKHPKAYG